MLESTASNNSDQKYTADRQIQFKLPRLEKQPSQWQKIKRLNSSKNDKQIILPNINQINNQLISRNSEEMVVHTQPINEQQDIFVMEMQQKLKNILDRNLKQQETEENYNHQDDDFLEKVNQNRQIIKQYKIKKQNQGQKKNLGNNIHNEKNQKILKKYRNQSLYEKRVKQYRQMSSENKILAKKKQTIAMKLKDNNNYNQKQKKSGQKISHKIQSPLMKIKNKFMSRQPSQPNIPRSQLLFDNIQNFLENPKIKRQSLGIPSTSRKMSKVDLEDKIKLLELKLGSNQQVQRYSKDNVIVNDSINGEWHKVQVREKNLGIVASNFQKQLQKVNHYQQRSQNSLDRYVQHQKMILELELHRKYHNEKRNSK